MGLPCSQLLLLMYKKLLGRNLGTRLATRFFNLLTLHAEAAQPPQTVYAMPLLSWTYQRLALRISSGS